MQPWYKVVELRKEVREGRSFSPDEFAIALEQVVAGTAPPDYSDPEQFFSRTCFTRALTEHSGMALRRLSGRTENTSPVLTLITQFGGGKTHTLASLYHLANAGRDAAKLPGVAGLLKDARVSHAPAARVGVFVGNAWDPQEGRETPWIDLARQLAGDQGVAALGSAARTSPPGTEALSRVFAAADGPVLLLFDEVLNFVNRHRGMAEPFHAFLQNLTVAVTGTTHAVAIISLPRSQIEMTAWDQEWQERITKVVRRVARDLIANDESEISEVVRRRLFEDLGKEGVRKHVARKYADWCMENSTRLPDAWTTVDTSTARATMARDFLRRRFEACYPFHPATLSVFQRKWRALAQFQQTRGALAMLAQWISWAAREQFRQARKEPLITLGSAPLHVPEFRAVVLGQLGEQRLDAAIDADIAGETAHAMALDADTDGALKNIHRRVGVAVLFESSGGQLDKVAHLPELRFALGEPDVDTTTVDSTASTLEKSGFFIRKVGADGYRIHHQATLRKVVSDRRASLDEEADVRPAIRKLVEAEFGHGAKVPVVYFPKDGNTVQDLPHLTLVVVDPVEEWYESGGIRDRIGRWTKERGKSTRLHPASLVWCVKKQGRQLRESVELFLAWQRVAREREEGLLGPNFNKADVDAGVGNAKEAAKEEVWASYRFVSLSDTQAAGGLKVIDLGAGHASRSDTLCGRVIAALKAEALLDESVGAGYIDRRWPPTFEETEAWPLKSLRQSFLNGTLTRLLDPEAVLRRKIVEFVKKGEFGLASGDRGNGQYERIWYKETVSPEEVAFESNVFLLTRSKAEGLQAPPVAPPQPEPVSTTSPNGPIESPPDPGPTLPPDAPPTVVGGTATLRIAGTVHPEVWNRIGTSIIPKLRAGGGSDLSVGIEFSVSIDAAQIGSLGADLRQALADLGLSDRVRVEPS